MNDRWLKHFISKALNMASMSKDPSRQVGCVFFDEAQKVEVSGGYNDLARGVIHNPERQERPLKYKYTAHAEINCIANAARLGRATYGSSCVVTMFPCSQCAAALINAGIKAVYTAAPIPNHPQYAEDHEHSYAQFKEADVTVFLIDDMIAEISANNLHIILDEGHYPPVTQEQIERIREISGDFSSVNDWDYGKFWILRSLNNERGS